MIKRSKRVSRGRMPGDVLLETKEDRRLFPNVPDKTGKRSNIDRRGRQVIDELENIDVTGFIKANQAGIRYKVAYDVKVVCKSEGKRYKFRCQGLDISMTGILLRIEDRENLDRLKTAQWIKLKFEILPGSMPEGMEMKVKILADIARIQEVSEKEFLCGLQFKEELSVYKMRRKDRYMLMISSILLFGITAFIVLMRAESVIYFDFYRWLYLHSIIAAFFLLSRYFFAVFYRPVPIDVDFTPGVTIVIPCFNEERWIRRTITSCINQDYPIDKLEVIVVDDCSSDNSPQIIRETVEELYRSDRAFEIDKRLKYILLDRNQGKKHALSKGVLEAKHELVVFVDSDSFLDPYAIRNVVQPFKDPKMGGVAGRTDVANTYTNVLTKIQAVRYYIAFRIMKAAESVFDTVTCLSGPLSCYRKEIVLENMEAWINQKFLGHKATFGDDRSMTNFVLRKHRTGYQDTVVTYTMVPNSHRVFLRQQMRWKRSWIRESLKAATFMWRKEPFAAITFYIGVFVPIFAPVVVVYNLIYIPIAYNIFPTTFVVGILLMAMLMSIAQLFLRRSTTWIFGLLFCLYYEAILLWQMPIAWVTFWKSTWGTRMTPSDVAAENRRKNGKKNSSKELMG